VKNLAHSASLHSRENIAPSKPGIKHLGAPGGVIVPIYLVPVLLSVASEKWFAGTSLELPLALASLLAWLATFGFCGFRSGEPEPNEYGIKPGPEFAISDLK
jgi:hypothetical protein